MMVIKLSWNYKRYLLILSLFLIASSVQSQKKLQGNYANLLDESVRYGKLKNGLTYYLQKNDTPENTIDLQLIVKVGIFQKDDTQLEYAHLLEHLGYTATKNFPEKTSYFNKPGIRTRAFTGFNHTGYTASISSKDEAALNDLLLLFKDITYNILLDKKSIDVQRAAVLGEIRTNNPYRDWKNEVIAKNLISNTDYKYLDEREGEKGIENFDYSKFLKFYKNWYHPDLQALIIVGDINLDDIEKKIQKDFSGLESFSNSNNPGNENYFPKINLKGQNRLLTITDTINPGLRLNIFSKRANSNFNPQNRNDYKELIYQKLYQNIAEDRSKMFKEGFNPLFTDFSSNYRLGELAGGQLRVSAMEITLDARNQKIILEQIRKALIAWKQIHSGISVKELHKAKEDLLKTLSNENSYSSSSLAKRYENHFVMGTYGMHPKEELEMSKEILQAIDLNDIRTYVQNAGDLSENTDFIFLRSKDQKVPDYNQIERYIKEVKIMKVSPLKPLKETIITIPKMTCAQHSEISKVENISENLIGVSSLTLKNGIKIIFKPLKPINENYRNTIQIVGYRDNKFPIENRNEYLEAGVVPELINYMGSGSFSKFEIEDFKKAHNIKLNFDVDKDFQSIKGECKVTELDDILNLINLYSSSFREDKVGFETWKRNKKQELHGQTLRGSSDFYTGEITALRYPQIPRIQLKDVDDITFKKLRQAHSKWFSNFANYTFIITGDFESGEIAPMLGNLLSCFPTGEVSKIDTFNILKFPLKKMEETVYLENINQVMVTLSFPIKIERNTKNIVLLQLIKRALNEQIWKRLREGCYIPRANGKWENINEDIYAFNISFDSAIGNENKMVDMALETFNDLKKNGVGKEWLENSIQMEVLTYDRKIDLFGIFNMWPEYLQNKDFNGQNTLPEILQHNAVLKHFISVEELNTSIKQFLSDEFLQEFIILPQNNNIE